MKQDLMNFRTFESPWDVNNWVNSNYSQEYINNLNDMLCRDTALMEYKGGVYKAMNRYLRNCDADSDACDIAGLQSFLMQCCLPEDIVVYRFVSWKELLFLWCKGVFGRTFHYPSFLSTTMLPDSYSMADIKKGRYKIRLFAPKGLPATFLPEINPKKPEFEVLFAYDMKMKQEGPCDFRIFRLKK